MSVPTQPQIRPRPKATDGTLEFWWQPPVSDGGSAITGYVIEIPSVYVDTTDGNARYYKITGLTNGVTYTAQIYAINGNGGGDLAYFRSVQPGLLPGPTQTQSFTRNSDGNATFTWSAPASDGGATIGWNVVTCYPLDSSGAVINRNVLGDETSLTIPDLSGGTTYTALVRSRNDPGYSSKAVYLAPVTFGTLPSDISGLRLWLDAADLTTLYGDASGVVPSSIELSQVRVWKDKSGFGHDASGGLVVGRLAAGVNGARYPCVRFTGGNTLVTSPFSASSHNSVSVFLVGQMADLATANQYFYYSSSNALFVLLDTSRGTNLLFNADGGTMLSAPTGAFLSIQKANTTDVVTTILKPTYSTNTDGRYNTESLNTSASISFGTNSVDVRISEFLLWDRALSGAEQTLVTTYLQNKWGFSAAAASVWTERTASGARFWYSIASSSDGTKLAAVADSAYIYTSTDSGATWTEQTASGQRVWRPIASSSDGTKLAAGNYAGYIYTSTDSGVTWTEQTGAGQRDWIGMASSSDGTKLAAVVLNGYIWTSTDSGATWTEQTASGQRVWYSIASSSDGTKLAAVADSAYIYTSTDSGATWTEQTASGQRFWRSIASSSDGTKLAAVDNSSGYIYTSSDSGATWTQQTASGQRGWFSIASSSDGTKLAAVDNSSGYIYRSTDSGATWTEQTDPGQRNWLSIASSSDGTKLAAGGNATYIWTYV